MTRALLAAIAALLILAAPAGAAEGRFTQFLCADPDTLTTFGRPALDGLRTDGTAATWRPSLTSTTACTNATPLSLRPPAGSVPSGAWAALRYELNEPGLTLTSGKLARTFRATGTNNGYIVTGQHAGTDTANPFAMPSNTHDRGQWNETPNGAQRGSTLHPYSSQVPLTVRDNRFAITAKCDATTCTHTADQWRYDLYAAELQIADAAAPTVLTASGGLYDGDATTGHLTLRASDVGAGLYRVVIFDDAGDEVHTQAVAPDSTTCRDAVPGSGDRYEFTRQVPCPHAATIDVNWNTATLRDGTHYFRVVLEDAAGNATTVVERAATIDNYPDPKPLAAAAPTVDGPPKPASTLTASPGGWLNAEDYRYAWQRCNASAAACVPLPWVLHPTYTLTDDDLGHRLRVVVTARNTAGETALATSPATPVIRNEASATPTTPTIPAPAPPPVYITTNPTPTAPALAATLLPSGPNGRGATKQARLQLTSPRTIRTRFTKATRVTGRLINESGAPITDAVLDVAATHRRLGARATTLPPVRTGNDGTFTYVIRRGPSRAIEFTYRADLADRTPAARTNLRLTVPAAVTLRVSQARIGRTTWLTGRLEHLPQAGVMLQVQALDGRRWRTFDTVKTTARGRYRFGYRFKATAAGRTFGMRVLVDSPAYAFAANASRAINVRVGS